jgi:hypothetical protein
MKLILSLILLCNLLFACLCQGKIDKAVQDVKKDLVTDSYEPYQEALKDSSKSIEEQIELIKEEIKQMNIEGKAQQMSTTELFLIRQKIETQNKQLTKQIEMESIE